MVVGAVAAYILREVIATVFVAGTVAYVLAPVERWYSSHGLPRWWSALATTITGLGIAGLVLSPLVGVVYFRFNGLGGVDELQSLVPSGAIPDSVTVSLYGFTRTVRLAELVPAAIDYLRSLALSLAGAAPVIALKATLFAMVVFALLLARWRLHNAVRAVVPEDYQDAVSRLTGRARDTLFAIYVLQAATALATFTISVPFFLLLGYQFPFTLATIAGFLQFIPIVGPSVLVLGLAGIDVAVGEVTRATVVVGAGLVLVGWLPDAIVRPRLARRTADMPGSLYFVGFTGGLFTIGVVGVIAGPLVVSVLGEAVRMLAEEMRAPHGTTVRPGQYGPAVTPDVDPDEAPLDTTSATDGGRRGVSPPLRGVGDDPGETASEGTESPPDTPPGPPHADGAPQADDPESRE